MTQTVKRDVENLEIRVQSLEDRVELLEDDNEDQQKVNERVKGGFMAVQWIGAFLTFLFGLAQCLDVG